jgi:hypothetical protein
MGLICDGVSATCIVEGSGGGGGTGQECPAGQVWNAYAGRCVVGETPGAGAGGATSDGCAGAPAGSPGPGGGLALLALWGLLALRLASRRRARRAPQD